MARKKKAETKTETSKEETNVSKDFDKSSMEDEKFSISELLEKNNIKVKTFSNLDKIEYVRIVDYNLSDISYKDDISQNDQEGI